jgi:hypothetical protein
MKQAPPRSWPIVPSSTGLHPFVERLGEPLREQIAPQADVPPPSVADSFSPAVTDVESRGVLTTDPGRPPTAGWGRG